MRLIGLTGGIGTGKTAVSNYLSQAHKIPVLDADIYAREAVQQNSPILAKIIHRYGENILLKDGNLHRQRLGEIIFNNSGEKLWLENQIHPYVRQRFESQIQASDAGTMVLVIPLLFESQMTDLVTEIWVVVCSQEEQIRRIMRRDNITREQAIARINNQLPLEQKMSRADVILDNEGDLANLHRQVDQYLASN
jgi:dephospho-CoA kinase